jgi:hypothetical protein
MSWKTLLFLAVVVALLGFAASRQLACEQRIEKDIDMALFEGFDESNVTAVVVENLERDIHLRCERDPVHGWHIVDPIQVRAENGLFDSIVQRAVARRCWPVPDAEIDVKKMGLDPPRRVLELERLENGAARRQRIETGAIDVDDMRMFARVRGRIVRVLRDLDTELELPLDEYKSHTATELTPSDVIEVHRSGFVVLEGESASTDMKLDALAEQGIWRATSPVEATLDPQAMWILAQTSAGLRFESFVDHGTRPQSELGLDPPEMWFRIATVGGKTCTLRFGHKDRRGGVWNGTVEGEPHVFAVDPNAVYLLATPLDKLLDHQLFRFARAQIDRVELHSAERELALVRDYQGTWTVAEARPGSRVFGPALPADKARVEELVAKLEKADVSSFKLDWKFDSAESKDAIFVHAGPAVAGALLGAEYAPESGGRAIRYQRQGESIVGLVDPDLLAIARTRASDLWSLKIGDFPEISLTGMKLGDSKNQIQYVRTNGLWKRAGAELEARELRTVLDALFFLRATEHVPESGQPKLEQPIRVELEMGDEKRVFEIGTVERDGKPRVEIEFEGRRSVLKRQDLHALLEAILRG